MILLLNCEFKGLKEKGHCLVDVITERNTGMSDLSRSSFNCPNMDLMKQNYDNDSLKQIKMWVRELVEDLKSNFEIKRRDSVNNGNFVCYGNLWEVCV